MEGFLTRAEATDQVGQDDGASLPEELADWTRRIEQLRQARRVLDARQQGDGAFCSEGIGPSTDEGYQFCCQELVLPFAVEIAPPVDQRSKKPEPLLGGVVVVPVE